MRTVCLFVLLLTTIWSNAQNVSTEALRKAGILKSVSTPQTYPIQIWNDFILIEAKVNGVPGTFIWDNGLSFSALDFAFAEKAGVLFNKHKKDTVVDGNDKMLQLETQYARKIQFGGFEEEHAPVFGLDIDRGFFKNREKKISGLIGGGFSNHFNWSFDFDKKTVTVSAKPIEKEGTKLKYLIDSFNNLHYLPLVLNGSDLYAQVDFGMVGEVFSGTDQLLPAFAGHSVITSVGYNSLSAGGLGRVDTIYTIRKNYSYILSGQQLKELPDIELSGSEQDFKIGVRFFMHYNVTVNNGDSNYILSERKTPLITRNKKGYGVFVLKEGEELLIGRMTNNPNLHGKNIQLMDKVKTINDKTAKDFYGLIDLRDYQDKLKDTGKKMVLKMTDGTAYTFTPQDDIAE